MSTKDAIQDHYDDEYQVCYGCGERNRHGHRLKSRVEGDRVVATYRPAEYEIGGPGFIYGGLIASLIDCHGVATAAEHFRERSADPGHTPRCVTASLHVDFRKPTPLGRHPIELSARIVEASERKAVADVELGVDGDVTAEGRVVAVLLPASMQAAVERG